MGNAFTGSLADGEAADTLILSGEDMSRAETQASVPWSLFLSLGKGLGPNDRKSLHLQEHVYHTVLCLGFTSLWGPCGGESILTRPRVKFPLNQRPRWKGQHRFHMVRGFISHEKAWQVETGKGEWMKPLPSGIRDSKPSPCPKPNFRLWSWGYF